MRELMLSTAFIAVAGFAANVGYADAVGKVDGLILVDAAVTGTADATTGAAADTASADVNAGADVSAGAVATGDAAAGTNADAAAQTDTSVDAATSADAATRTPIVREGFTVAETASLTSDVLIGAKAYDADDVSVGEVSKLVIDADNKMTDVVIDVGGFLGIGEKPVALKVSDIDILRATAGGEIRVYVSMTKDQLEALPTYSG